MGCGVALEKTRAMYSAHSWSHDDNLCPGWRPPTQCLVVVPASTRTAGLCSPHLHGGTKSPAWRPNPAATHGGPCPAAPTTSYMPRVGHRHPWLRRADPCACSGAAQPQSPQYSCTGLRPRGAHGRPNAATCLPFDPCRGGLRDFWGHLYCAGIHWDDWDSQSYTGLYWNGARAVEKVTLGSTGIAVRHGGTTTAL